VGPRLSRDGVFCLYGPFNVAGCYTATSNESFDRQLRQRNPAMGLRDVVQLERLSARHHMRLEERRQLPANNLLLVFRCTRGP
jgi:hypothetical protein